MRKIIILVMSVLLGIQSQACTVIESEAMALQAALVIEKLNGGTPLTHEVFSLSNKPNTWGVLLSYSGVQRGYFVTLEPTLCHIIGIYARN